ncbi:MAG: TrkA family potassium uptake protein [Oscillospiraceae bacterium]
MRVCIVGGGKLGYYLAKTLLEHGHNPTIVEQDLAACEHTANSLDIPVIHGDGTTMLVLQSADVEGCQALVAVTGRDEDNLISCQLAKQVFKVKKTVARVNNPKNAEVLKSLGVDIAVSSTDNIARLIEREVETASIQQLLSLAGGTVSLTEIQIPPTFRYTGQTLAQLVIPPDVVIISVTRNGQFIIPRGTTQIISGDKVMVLAKDTAFHTLNTDWRIIATKS